MATTQKFNSKSPTIRRILREAQELSTSPSADYTATPLESDLFEWHFTLRGPPNSAYAGGIYHGRIVLPPTYPLRPPAFRFVTPSGRFETNREICLSISGHHEETWQPAWGLRTALVALRSFMETDAKGQLGGLETSDAVRKRLAQESGGFRCGACSTKTNAEIMAECEELVKQHQQEAGSSKQEKEVEVPKELKMGWRDEMTQQEGQTSSATTAAAAGTDIGGPSTAVAGEDEESAQLAEGFVQTVPIQQQLAGSAGGAVQGERDTSAAAAAARPGQGVPQPTRTVPLPNTNPQPPHAVQPQVRRPAVSNDGVPVWIDRLIAVLGVLLVALILKVLVA
ncbi:putative ubiquitin-conjugating enzyme [Diplogelasinospora grovesii]|uniref:Ubiquitin-conjugating enzyme n=1 Tax=Diplogelasinospora grovesii TaxID=303347 RepID=A0AAN6N7S1_9PEZI|nr:putative ubiquitin-conjugating enzyme [Diplogelasinospora grovesii]